MKHKDFSFQLIVRTLLLLTSVLGTGILFYFTLGRHLVFIPLILMVLIGIQVYGIIALVNRANHEITDVFEMIRKGNFFPTLPAGKYTDSFADLFYSINELFSSIRSSETQKEAYNLFTEMLVSRIPAGVILLETDGKIGLINESARQILHLPNFYQWSEIQKCLPGFARLVDSLGTSGADLLKLESNGQLYYLSVNVRTIILLGSMKKIITFHDVRNSIEKTEIEAWSKLFRVIRHEILNSVTPISSLAETMQMILDSSPGLRGENSSIPRKDVEDIMECVNAIKHRSDGLFSFVNLYRDISKIPVPVKEEVSVCELFASVSTLLKPKSGEAGVELIITGPVPDMIFLGDFGLMQQVLINLVNNSLSAVRMVKEPRIMITADLSGTTLHILVHDNGHGIPPDLIEDIFVPFFTTRKDGSGLGLSLVKQIIVSHGGNISVESVEQQYTRFRIELPAIDQQN